MQQKLLLAPSVLSADFSKLSSEIDAVKSAGADWLHLDIMDGHFVPNITFGPFIVKHIRQYTDMYLDSHLMIENPGDYVEEFAKAGSNVITIHQEAAIHLDAVINQIKSLGCKAGVSINPSTPVHTLENILPEVDLVLIMSVNPGFGGQKLIPYCLDKVRDLRSRIDSLGKDIVLQIDGGIKVDNIQEAIEAGADSFVAGSAVFNGKPAEAVSAFKAKMGV